MRLLLPCSLYPLHDPVSLCVVFSSFSRADSGEGYVKDLGTTPRSAQEEDIRQQQKRPSASGFWSLLSAVPKYSRRVRGALLPFPEASPSECLPPQNFPQTFPEESNSDWACMIRAVQLRDRTGKSDSLGAFREIMIQQETGLVVTQPLTDHSRLAHNLAEAPSSRLAPRV